MGMMRMFLMRLLLLLSHCPDQSAALEVALTLAGEVMHVSVDEPLQRSDRRSIAEAALRSHRNLLSRLPTGICSDDDGGSRQLLARARLLERGQPYDPSGGRDQGAEVLQQCVCFASPRYSYAILSDGGSPAHPPNYRTLCSCSAHARPDSL